MAVKSRTLSEILIDVDNCVLSSQVNKLWEELNHSMYILPKHEFLFGAEHIRSKTQELRRKENLQKLKSII